MIRFRRALLALIALVLAALAGTAAHAQATDDIATRLGRAEADVRAIERRSAGARDEADGALLRARLATARQSASAVVEQVTGELAAVDARIAELGPKAAGVVEPPEVGRQRAALAAERLTLDAAAKRARLLQLEAEQLGTEIQRKQAVQFGQRMSRRAGSPLMPGFWSAVLGSLDRDLGRIGRFVGAGVREARGRGPATVLLLVAIGVAAALVLIGPARRGALRLGQRYLISDAPGHRLRRSAYAVWVMLVGTIMPLLGAIVLVVALASSTPSWLPLLQAFILSTGFAAFTAAVLGAVLMRSQPSWRLAPISDPVAERLRPLSWILAAITFVGSLIEAFNIAVGASAAALAASHAIEAAVSLLLIGGALLALGHLHAAEIDREAEAEAAAARAGVGALSLVLWIVVLVSAAALALGYIEFSQFLVTMIVWSTVLGAATYLLMNAADDAVTGLFSRGSRLGRTLVRGVGVRASSVDQFGVLLSGAVRVVLGLIAFVLMIAPFGAGSGVGSTVERIASVVDGIEIGGVAVSPGTIVRGAVVLLVGLALVRGFMAWLEKRYLPATELDGSGRNSVSLIARYIGVALAAIWALASLGIGVERIALLLSALSVGIGFGLQAITQNFISGLILLAERPIKIGDLIKVGNDEGDVKRISVRSTELELGDHSTLIIPNSELITKSVLNKTLASPLGRVQVQFSVPIDADADAVERILLAAYADEPAILAEPPPSVFIDSIAEGRTVFNSFAAVSGPRAAYGARSRVLKALMRRLRAAEIDIGTAPQRLELLNPPLAGQRPDTAA